MEDWGDSHQTSLMQRWGGLRVEREELAKKASWPPSHSTPQPRKTMGRRVRASGPPSFPSDASFVPSGVRESGPAPVPVRVREGMEKEEAGTGRVSVEGGREVLAEVLGAARGEEEGAGEEADGGDDGEAHEELPQAAHPPQHPLHPPLHPTLTLPGQVSQSGLQSKRED